MNAISHHLIDFKTIRVLMPPYSFNLSITFVNNCDNSTSTTFNVSVLLVESTTGQQIGANGTVTVGTPTTFTVNWPVTPPPTHWKVNNVTQANGQPACARTCSRGKTCQNTATNPRTYPIPAGGGPMTGTYRIQCDCV